jgi:HEAT repeat protein
MNSEMNESVASLDAERLIKTIKDNTGDANPEVANALIKIGKPAVDPLILALKSEISRVRSSAAWILGKIGDVSAVIPLGESLQDEDHYVRESAARALGEIGDPNAIKYLIEALRDKVSPVKELVSKALGRFGELAIDPLAEALKDGNWSVRYYAVQALEGTGNKRAIDLLRSALNDGNNYVRERAAMALNKLINT